MKETFDPSSSQMSLRKLENLQYRIDRPNFLRFAAMNGILEDSKRVMGDSGNNEIRSFVRKVCYGSKASHGLMWWRNIYAAAKYLKVPPELLIDEEYYFQAYGVASYRIPFIMADKGMTMEELTYREGISNVARYATSWYTAWYSFLKCRVYARMGLFHLPKVITQVVEKLGVPLGALVVRQLHTVPKATAAYAELSNLLSVLDDRECAALAGFARAMHKNHFKHDQQALVEDVNTALRWFLGDAQEKS